MAGGCGVGAFCSFCGKCGRVFNTLFDACDVPEVLPPGVSAEDVAADDAAPVGEGLANGESGENDDAVEPLSR